MNRRPIHLTLILLLVVHLAFLTGCQNGGSSLFFVNLEQGYWPEGIPTEPGRLSDRESLPCTVLMLDGTYLYKTFLTLESPVLHRVLDGNFLYYALSDENGDSNIYMYDLQSDDISSLGSIPGQVYDMAVCPICVFLIVLPPGGHELVMVVLKDGEALYLETASVCRALACDGAYGFFQEYDQELKQFTLCRYDAAVMEKTVVANNPRQIRSLSFSGGRIYYTDEAGCHSIKEDGTDLRTEYDGLCDAVAWKGKLLLVLKPDKNLPDGSPFQLLVRDLPSGEETDFGGIWLDESSGRSFTKYVFFADNGFVLVRPNWYAESAEAANRYYFYSWQGVRQELQESPDPGRV